MHEKPVAHSRAPQILNLLYEYGPLSAQGLQSLINPAITTRRLQEALQRLYEKNLVIKRFEASPHSRQYYELSQREQNIKLISKLINVPEEKLIQPYFRSQELLHSEQCAKWSYYLKRLYPEALVARDFQLKHHEVISNALINFGDEEDILPDIVLYFGETPNSHAVTIAFEIELSQKSNARIFEKLKRYTQGTRVDGVVYLCRKNTLIQTISHIYTKTVLKNVVRINHYDDFFLLFGDSSFNAETFEPNLFNSRAEAVSFLSWIHTLRTHDEYNRRELKLIKPACQRWS